MLKRTMLLTVLMLTIGLLAACQTSQPTDVPSALLTPIVPVDVAGFDGDFAALSRTGNGCSADRVGCDSCAPDRATCGHRDAAASHTDDGGSNGNAAAVINRLHVSRGVPGRRELSR